MSLFATRDGRWVLWNEDGYFDAAKNADGLIGWTINRSDGEQTDYYPMSRYRDKFFRPEIFGRPLVQKPIGEGGGQAFMTVRALQSGTVPLAPLDLVSGGPRLP